MAYKDSTAERTTITRNLKDMEDTVGNIYETIVVLSKRSNQINVEMKEELDQKLDEFATSTDNLEEIFEEGAVPESVNEEDVALDENEVTLEEETNSDSNADLSNEEVEDKSDT